MKRHNDLQDYISFIFSLVFFFVVFFFGVVVFLFSTYEISFREFLILFEPKGLIVKKLMKVNRRKSISL